MIPHVDTYIVHYDLKEAGGGGGGGGEVEIQYQCSKTISKENHMWKESDQVRSFTPQIIP